MAESPWPGWVPAYNAVEAFRRLAAARDRVALLVPTDPSAPAAAAEVALVAADALRVLLVRTGRTAYEAMRADDQTYVAYDMTRRLELLAESVGEPRTWPGMTSRARWVGQVAYWGSFDLGPDPRSGFARLAPLVGELHQLLPLPGMDPVEAALRLVEPVLAATIQHALHWAVPAAQLLIRLRPLAELRVDPVSNGFYFEAGTWAPELNRLRQDNPRLMSAYDALVQIELELFAEVAPSKRAGGHMDVRPDEATVRGLEWRTAATIGVIVLLGREHLERQGGPWSALARAAYAVLDSVTTTGAWPDEAVQSARQLVILALVLTVSEASSAFPPSGSLG